MTARRAVKGLPHSTLSDAHALFDPALLTPLIADLWSRLLALATGARPDSYDWAMMTHVAGGLLPADEEFYRILARRRAERQRAAEWPKAYRAGRKNVEQFAGRAGPGRRGWWCALGSVALGRCLAAPQAQPPHAPQQADRSPGQRRR